MLWLLWIKICNKYYEHKYNRFCKKLKEQERRFKDIIKKCYSSSSEERLNASVELARYVGVPEEDILHSDKEAEAFFMS